MSRITGDLKDRTLRFATSVLDAVTELPNDPRGWVVAKQLGRAGTSIGANVWESDAAHSDADFANKISIARKETCETQYWLRLAHHADLLTEDRFGPLANEADELVKILGTIVRKTQDHMKTRKR